MDSENTARKYELMEADQRAAALSKEDSVFLNVAKFEQMQRVAVMLSKSDFVPTRFRGNAGNCMIALDMASLMGMHPLMLMRTMYVVNGEPGFEGKFVSALINNSGRYVDPLEYEWKGETGQQKWGCRAFAVRKKTGKMVHGPWVTWEMVQKEGWNKPKGSMTSKWSTMPEIMFLYRAATFFGRTYDSDLLMGMKTVEEINDIHTELVRGRDGSFSMPDPESKPTAETYKPTGKPPMTIKAKDQPPAEGGDGQQDGLIDEILVDEFGTEKDSPFEKSKWFHQRAGSPKKGTGFAAYVEANMDRLKEASKMAFKVMIEKYEVLYGQPCPWAIEPQENAQSDEEQPFNDDPETEQGAGQVVGQDENKIPSDSNQVPVLETDAAKVLADCATRHRREYMMVVRGRNPESVDQIFDWIDQINQLVVNHKVGPHGDPDKF